MSDDALIRLSNLKAMGVTPAVLVERVGKTRSYWSDLLRGQKSFGEKTARNIEERLGLRRGALDQNEDASHSTALRDTNVNNVTRSQGSPGKGSVTADIQWDSKQEIPTSMPYAPEHLKSAVMLIGSLLGALDERSRKTIGNVLNDLALAPDEASYFADIAVSAAKTQRPLTDNIELERALRPMRKPVHND